jgi:hypothetical protein
MRGEVFTVFWWGTLREGKHLVDPGIFGRIILKWIFSTWNRGSMDFSDLALNRDTGWAPVNTLTNLGFREMFTE